MGKVDRLKFLAQQVDVAGGESLRDGANTLECTQKDQIRQSLLLASESEGQGENPKGSRWRKKGGRRRRRGHETPRGASSSTRRDIRTGLQT